MSQPSARPPTPPPPLPPPARNGCLTAILMLVGLILLFPGLCGIIGVSYQVTQTKINWTALSVSVQYLAYGVGGIVLIWFAMRPRP